MLLDTLSYKVDVGCEGHISRNPLVHKLERISIQPHIRASTRDAVCAGFALVLALALLGRETDVFMAVEYPEFGGESLATTPDESN